MTVPLSITVVNNFPRTPHVNSLTTPSLLSMALMRLVILIDSSLLQVRDRLPHLKAIVQYKGKLSQEYPNVYEVTCTHTQI